YSQPPTPHPYTLSLHDALPIFLKNNPFSASMEGVVESYGLPVKGEIDPTTIMSFFYVFFFGMMLSDAAYGLIVAVVCGVLVWKRSEEHTSELQSRFDLVCRLLL